ncbi:hypothetical protein ACI2UK_24385 [Ralstonia nicotianae]|uniref:hypothetical protein n=1 Tax=Ralstonia pseudosolanacearum TaxID=1310165 RepID=UPI0020058948|nr:hypothetical protein [Ralstonia pseudosolanacearum]MCK4120419.1 hypothetical protein [Ralstonia pseudosolanacearum]
MTETFLIRCTSTRFPDTGQAMDALAGSSCIPGYRFGYIDEQHRVVAFFDDSEPGSMLPLQRGLRRVQGRLPLLTGPS